MRPIPVWRAAHPPIAYTGLSGSRGSPGCYWAGCPSRHIVHPHPGQRSGRAAPGSTLLGRINRPMRNTCKWPGGRRARGPGGGKRREPPTNKDQPVGRRSADVVRARNATRPEQVPGTAATGWGVLPACRARQRIRSKRPGPSSDRTAFPGAVGSRRRCRCLKMSGINWPAYPADTGEQDQPQEQHWSKAQRMRFHAAQRPTTTKAVRRHCTTTGPLGAWSRSGYPAGMNSPYGPVGRLAHGLERRGRR